MYPPRQFRMETYNSEGQLEGRADTNHQDDACEFARKESANRKTVVITSMNWQKIFCIYINGRQITAWI